MVPAKRAAFLPLLTLAALVFSMGCATTDRAKPEADKPGGDGKPTSTTPEPVQKDPPRFDNLITLSGQPTRLADHRKKVTVLVFWATYCTPCIHEMPFVEALHQKYKGDPEVAILSVCTDHAAGPKELAALQAIVQKKGLTAPVLLDGNKKLVRHVTSMLPPPPGTPDPGSGDGEEEFSFALPLNAVIDRNFDAYVWIGLSDKLNEESYVKKLSKLVEQGRAGRLPESPPQRSMAPSATTGKPEDMTIKLPENLTLEQRMKNVSSIRGLLTKTNPHLTPEQVEALMKLVEEQLRAGPVVSLEIPPAAAPAP
jgi:thiol-disulfide isomerase/thioredoxin